MSPSNNLLLKLLPCVLCAGLFCCSGDVHHVVYAYAYGTNWEIHLYQGNKADAEEIESYVLSTSRLFDLEASSCPNGVYALNHHPSVAADPLVVEAYELASAVEQELPEGYCSALGDLTAAWLDHLEKGELLDDSEKEELLSKAKATTVSRQGNVLSKAGEGSIDYGSLAKGLCLDHIGKTLKEKGIDRYFINAGSSSLLFGQNHSPDGATKVNLLDANGYSFRAKDCAVSTSSTSRQAYRVNGVLYSHIVDPRNGNAHVDYDALCLQGSGAGYLDALSTALLVLGPEQAKTYESKGIRYAFMKGGEVVDATPGFLEKA